MNKFKAQSCVIPEIFHQFCGFNDPKWHNHAVKQLSREALTTFYMSLMIQLETSFMYIQKSFKSFKDTFDNLLKLFMATLNTLKEAAVWQKSHPLKLMCQKCYILDMHVLPTAKHLNAYLSKEKTILKKPMNVLAEKKNFESVNLNEYLSKMTKDTCCILMKKLKMHGLNMIECMEQHWFIQEKFLELQVTFHVDGGNSVQFTLVD